MDNQAIIIPFLANLFELGVQFNIEGDRLHYRAPKGIVDSQVLKQLREHKPKIIAFLRSRGWGHKVLPPITRQLRLEGKEWPLSFSQQRIWFLEQLNPGDSAYNVPACLKIRGEWNSTAFEGALKDLIGCHESLRTFFVARDGQPVQMITSEISVSVLVVDISNLTHEQQQDEQARIADEFIQRPFQLSEAPLLRALHVRKAPTDHLLLLTMHHIICDAWSISIFVRDLAALYERRLSGRGSPVLEAPIQYVDYACWQRNVQPLLFEEQLSYWLKQLSDVQVLELPTDRPRSTGRRGPTAIHTFSIAPKLFDEVSKLSRAHGATAYMLFLAAFQLLLSYYSSQEDIVIGFPTANRNHNGVEGVIGFFINVLAFRLNLAGDPSFLQVLQHARNTAFDAYMHQDVPFEMIVERLQPSRSVARSPIFEVLFVFQNNQQPVIEFPGITVEEQAVQRYRDPYELMFVMTPAGNGSWSGIFKYDSYLFDGTTIEMLAQDFLDLLNSIIATPEDSISRLLAQSGSAKHTAEPPAINVSLQLPFIPFVEEDKNQILSDRFQEITSQYAGHVAISTPEKQWTYDQLRQVAKPVGGALFELLKSGQERVCLLFDHEADMIVAILATLMAGKTYVPLDPLYPLERLAYMLADSGASAILTDDLHVALAERMAGENIRIINVNHLSHQLQSEIDMSAGRKDADSIACILYSSGSGGEPKGIVQTHRSIFHIVANYTNCLHINAADRCTVLSSYSHVMAMIDIYAALFNGATLYPVNVRRRGVAILKDYIFEQGITVYRSIASLFRALTATLTRGDELSRLRAVVLGAEPVYRSDFNLYRQLCSSKCIFVNTYGSTEATISTIAALTHDSEFPGDRVPIGYPVGGNKVILISESKRPSLLFGEIAIGNKYLSPGYWNRPADNARAYFADPTDPKQRMYRTGDLARRQKDGSFVIVGRKDSQVKVRGFRIDLGEVERCLSEHRSVRKAAVVSSDDSVRGMYLHAYIEARSPLVPSQAELLEYLSQKLPDYMVPAGCTILESLPLTPNGKLDRKTLSARIPAPEHDVQHYVAPETPLEEIVAGVWSDVLGIEQIGTEDNFFALGGHSLLATQLVSRLQEITKAPIPLRLIFEAPTIRSFAARLEKLTISPGSWKAIEKVARRDRLRLSSAQKRIWLLNKIDTAGSYNIPYALRVRGKLDLKALQSALDKLIQRHELLRTRFTEIDGTPYQSVEPQTRCIVSHYTAEQLSKSRI
jgi:amino acid adenylation domain-containing protein